MKTKISGVLFGGFLLGVISTGSVFAQEFDVDTLLEESGISNVDDGSGDGSANASVNGMDLEAGENARLEKDGEVLQAEGEAIERAPENLVSQPILQKKESSELHNSGVVAPSSVEKQVEPTNKSQQRLPKSGSGLIWGFLSVLFVSFFLFFNTNLWKRNC